MNYKNSNLARDILLCRDCGASEAYGKPVPGEGPKEAQIVFIGRSPGITEYQYGRPFIGKGGDLFDKHLGMLGLDRGKLGIINVLNCYKENDEAPTKLELTICRNNFLKRKIQFFDQAKVFFTCGNDSTRIVMNSWSFPSVTKFPSPRRTPKGKYIFPIFHVGYMLRSLKAKSNFEVFEIKRIKRFLGEYALEAYNHSRLEGTKC
ncbi:MAG TPA: hypothetical protein ENI23_14285 [bacterium]|nr:hypothetical protein [bacterium]